MLSVKWAWEACKNLLFSFLLWDNTRQCLGLCIPGELRGTIWDVRAETQVGQVQGKYYPICCIIALTPASENLQVSPALGDDMYISCLDWDLPCCPGESSVDKHMDTPAALGRP